MNNKKSTCILKEVKLKKNGGGYSYGQVCLPKKYIGEVVIVSFASQKEITDIGITSRATIDSASKNRMNIRRKKLEKHLNKLRKIREKRGYGRSY